MHERIQASAGQVALRLVEHLYAVLSVRDPLIFDLVEASMRTELSHASSERDQDELDRALSLMARVREVGS